MLLPPDDYAKNRYEERLREAERDRAGRRALRRKRAEARERHGLERIRHLLRRTRRAL
ncbi:MAG TPA: hypothetical protein VI076_15750 [Actinopolymorphaceae bacterium]